MSLLNEDEINQRLRTLSGWSRAGNSLCKRFTLKTFSEAMELVNRIATTAEKANHHPDIDIRYNVVQLSLSTHSAGGITAKDFELAGQIEAAARRLP